MQRENLSERRRRGERGWGWGREREREEAGSEKKKKAPMASWTWNGSVETRGMHANKKHMHESSLPTHVPLD